MVVSTCELYLYQEIYRASRQFPFFGWVEASVTWHTGLLQWRSQNRSGMCEIRLTKLPCAAQRVGIMHFYAVTEIKGLSCRLRWIREWRNLLTSTHVGYRVSHVGSRESLKVGVQGASATNWFSRVNGARDNGIRLYLNQCWLINILQNTFQQCCG